MEREAQRSDLIADLFAAAIDDELWPGLTGLVGRLAGIEAVSLWIVDRGEYADFLVAPPFVPLVPSYLERYGAIDPWAASLARRPLETVMLGYEHLDEHQLLRSEFYNDWARVGGMFRPIGVKMRLASGVYATVGSDNPFAKRLFEEDDKRRIAAVLPYVKRALQLRWRQRSAGGEARLYRSALETFADAVLICDGNARTVFANAAAEELDRGGRGIVIGPRGNPVRTLAAAETQALARLIEATARGGPGGVARISTADGAPGLIALVTPLPRGLAGDPSPRHALVTLRPVGEPARLDQAMLIDLFGLSPAQAAIAAGIFAGKSPEEVAAARGIKISTVRSHLAAIFARTGTANQRGLVRLLGSLPGAAMPAGPAPD